MASGRSSGPARGAAREAILDAAQRLLASQGVGATSTTAIAKEAGVATGLIFYHFTGKDHLLDTLIAERTFAPELRRLLAEQQGADIQETLRLIGTEFLAVLERRCEIASILLQEVATAPSDQAHLPRIIEHAVEDLASHMEQADTVALSAAQARTAARMFLSTLLVAGLMLAPDVDRDTFVATLAGASLSGGAASA